MGLLGSMTVRFGGDTSGLQTAVKGVSSMLGGLPGPAGLAVGAVVGVAAAIVGIGAVSVKMAADYQQGMDKVKALTGSSDDAMRQYDAGLKQLAIDAGVAPTALTDGLYNVLSASYKGADAMKVLTLATEDSKIGMVSATITTDALTNVLRSFGVQSKDITRTNGEMLETVTLGKASFEQYATTIVKSASAAVQFHVSMETMNAAWATMTSSGIKAAQASTDFQQSLKVMYGNIGTVTKALEKNGIAFDETKFNAMSYGDKIVYLNKALQEANDKHVKVTGVTLQAAQAISTISKHIGDYNANLATLSDKQAMADKTAKAWAITQEGFNQQVDRAKAALSVLSMNIGQQLLPVLTKIVGAVTPIITAFAGWVTQTNAIQNALDFLHNIIGNIGQAFNDVFHPIQKMQEALKPIIELGKPLFDTFDRGTSILKDTYTGFGKLTDTFDRATGIIKATTEAVKPLTDTFDRAHGVIKSTSKAGLTLLDTFDRASGIIKTTTNSVKNSENPWKAFFENVKNVVVFLAKIDWGGIGNAINNINKSMSSAASVIGKVDWGSIFKAIGTGVQNVSAALSKVDWGHVFSVLLDAMKQINGFMKDTFEPVWQQLVYSFNDIKAALQPIMPQLIEVGQIIGIAIVGAVILAIAIFSGLISVFAAVITGVSEFVTGVIQFFSGLLQAITGITQLIGDVITGKFGNIGTDIDRIMHGILEMFVGVWNMIKGIWTIAIGSIEGFAHGFVSAIIGIFTHLADMLVGHSIIPDMIRNIVQWFAGLPAAAVNAVRNLLSMLGGFFGTLASQAIGWGKNLIQGIINGIGSMFGQVSSKMHDLVGLIGSFLPHSPAKQGELAHLNDYGPALVKGFASGIDKAAPSLKMSMDKLVGPMAYPKNGASNTTANSSSSDTSGNQDIYIMLDGQVLTHVVSSRQAKLVRLRQGRRAA